MSSNTPTYLPNGQKHAPKKPLALPLKRCAEDYLLERIATRHEKTGEWTRHLLRHFVAFCEREGVHSVQELSRQVWLEFLQALKASEYSRWTVRGIAAVARGFLRWCEAEGLIEPNTVRTGDLPPCPPPEPKPLTQEQVARLLALVKQREGWKSKRDYALMLALLDVGLRRSELLQMKLCHAQTGVVLVEQKGGRFHATYLAYETQKAIRAYLRAFQQATGQELTPESPLWWASAGKPLKPAGLRQILRRLGERAGERLYAHRLRASSITLRFASGASSEVVRDCIGHTSERAIRHYAKLGELDKARLIRQTSPLNLLKRKG